MKLSLRIVRVLKMWAAQNVGVLDNFGMSINRDLCVYRHHWDCLVSRGGTYPSLPAHVFGTVGTSSWICRSPWCRVTDSARIPSVALQSEIEIIVISLRILPQYLPVSRSGYAIPRGVGVQGRVRCWGVVWERIGWMCVVRSTPTSHNIREPRTSFS